MLGERKTTGYVVKNWTGYDRRVLKQNTNHLERYSQWISAVKKRPADYTDAAERTACGYRAPPAQTAEAHCGVCTAR